MQLSWQHFVGGVGLVFAAMIAWFGALWLNLQGANLWVFRLCIFLLLALAVAAIVWWLRNRQKTKPAGGTSSGADSASGAGVAEDILLVLREAEARVASSTQLPSGTRLSSLPVIFLVGDSAAGKTCVATQSGLEPELLSGQVYQEGNIAPTRLANLWFARKAVFVEMGGKTLGDANLWTRLLHRLAPGKLRSIFSGKPAAPRVAVVCYDSEKLAKAAGPEEITAQSRAIRARLEQISQTLGISFPVYVLFTRADRLPFFDDFFRNLSDSEVTQVLGVTLPPLPASATGVYAEQETKRLTGAFNSMFHSLAECRPGLLYRERNPEKLPGIYEFPRELQKRIAIATQFLVDLCRPSHLRTSAFLRGFYFTGIRQVEAANPLGGTVLASKTSVMQARPFSANATSLMRADDLTKTQSQGWQTATVSGSAGESRRTTQWLFLSHIFSHVILQDRAALGASGASSRANVLKRVLLAAVAAIAVIWFFGMIISFFGNRALEQEVRSAAEAIVSIKAQAPSMASLEDLRRLDAAREQLQRLTEYRHGTPLHLRWGLYSGNEIYDDFRNLYFTRFRQLLLGGVETGLGESLRTLPPAASPSDEWQRPYESLKAYLITTSNSDKSTRQFLSPVLMNRWLGNSAVEEQRQQLARAQFDFYADELRAENPFSLPEDSFVVQPARRFLNSFATGAQLVYQKMLVKANQAVPSFNFLQRYPEAKDVVAETKIIDGAFTGAGWKVMTDAISHPENYAGGDDWVLGTATGTRTTQNVSPQDVRALYEADYKKQWREFLGGATVRHFVGPQDESRQLEKLTGNRSPLLALLCEISQNVADASPEIAVAFQPVQEVVAAKPTPQSCREQLKQPSNDVYTNALVAVKFCLDSYLTMPAQPGVTPDPRQAKLNECSNLSLQARNVARTQVVKTNDPTWKVDTTVISLLLAPTAPPPNPQPPGGPTGVPQFCSALLTLGAKFPFDPNSHQSATLAEFNGVFQLGTGAVSKFLDANKAVFELQGSQYVQKSGKTNYSHLINQAASIQRALYSGNPIQPQFQFTLRARAPEGETSEVVTIDGQDLKLSGGTLKTQTFTWPGNQAGATLTLNGMSYGQYPGPWGTFQFFQDYNWMPTATGFHLESTLRGMGGQTVQLNGKNVVVQFDLDSAGVPLFQRGFISGLRCPRGAK